MKSADSPAIEFNRRSDGVQGSSIFEKVAGPGFIEGILPLHTQNDKIGENLEAARTVQERVRHLLAESRETLTAFSARIGVDKSALSQLLAAKSCKLPRTETLLAIARQHNVSVDWLLGISQSRGLIGEFHGAVAVVENAEGGSMLKRWHAEARGAKIRHIPADLSEMLRSAQMVNHDVSDLQLDPKAARPDLKTRLSDHQWASFNAEVCIPTQKISEFANGGKTSSGMTKAKRRSYLETLAISVAELYPAVRVYVFDGGSKHSVPYTIYGSTRAAVLVGDSYLVLRSSEAVFSMQREFDSLVREAKVQPHQTAEFLLGV